jgi:hypothetical protein
MEDRNLKDDDGMHQALVVLRESSAYGVAMFPEDGGEGNTGKKRKDDVMGVGDKIVMERARKRRKELEEEEEEEEREEARRKAEMEMDTDVEMERVKVKEKVSGKKRKGKEREEQEVQEQEVSVERARPRPRPIAKASSSMNIQPPSDLEVEGPPQPLQPLAHRESSQNQSGTRVKSRTRNMDSDMDTDSSNGLSSRPVMDLGASESDGCHPPTSEGRKRLPVASQARKPSSRRVASRDLGVLNLGSDSDASLGSRTSTKQSMRRCSSNSMETNGISIEEETPKPMRLPRTGESSDIKPLMIARMRRPQKNDSG